MTDHHPDCEDATGAYPGSCTCAVIKRKEAMDNLIAQDADLIDSPLVAAVRELLTDDSMEHLDTFTHNLIQAFDKHGLKAVSTDYLDNLNDTVRGLRQDIKAEQKHTDNALDNMDAAYRRVERLREELAEAYIKLSGKSTHTSDCATSNAPAMEPGPCDCAALKGTEQ